MLYEYQGDPAGSRSMELTCVKVNSIDADGLWFRGTDEEGMESEITVAGLTPGVLLAALREWGY